jgi:hypothetical protein
MNDTEQKQETQPETGVEKLAAALSKAQGIFKNPAKDRENPYFKSRYATLDAMQTATRNALAENGLSVVQLPQPADNGTWELHTVLLHSSGQSIRSRLPLFSFPKGPQAAGSEITYMRRYAYAAILNIAADEDDDGNGAKPPEQSIEDRVAQSSVPRNYKLDTPPVAATPKEQTYQGKIEKVWDYAADAKDSDKRQWYNATIALGRIWTRKPKVGEMLIEANGLVVNLRLLVGSKPEVFQVLDVQPVPSAETRAAVEHEPDDIPF